MRKRWWYACFIGMATGAISLVFVPLRRAIVDGAVQGNVRDALYIGLAMLLIYGFLSRIRDGAETSAKRCYLKFDAETDAQNLARYAELPFAEAEDARTRARYEKAKAATPAAGDAERALRRLGATGAELAGLWVIFLRYDVLVGAGLFVAMALSVSLQWQTRAFESSLWKTYIENMRRARYFSETLLDQRGRAEAKVFKTLSFFRGKYDEAHRRAEGENRKLGRRRLALDLSRRAVACGLFALFFARIFPMLSSGAVTIGVETTLVYAILDAVRLSDQLAASVFDLSSASMKRKEAKAWLEGRDALGKPASEMPETIQTVSFRDVHFAYPGSTREVLRGVTMTLRAGEDVALIGENGSGKSTLTKLMAGLYAPTKGEVLINGKPIASFSRAQLSKMIGLVAQHAYAYPLTWGESLALGGRMVRDIPEPLELEALVRKLPKGEDTPLTPLFDDGVMLSGGEWQKLSIARTLGKDRSLYILDEPNAALDPLLEARLYGVYREVLSGKLSLMISHRLGATRRCQRILILRDGVIHADGSHETLMETSPYYAELYGAQRDLMRGGAR